MTEKTVLTQEDFEALLFWFSQNREEAGARYEEIRKGLMRFFYFKGCSEPEILTDETINRAAKKIAAFDIKDERSPVAAYFYGFAAKIYLEYRRSVEKKNIPFEPDLHSNLRSEGMDGDEANNVAETRQECLDKCLMNLSPENRYLVVEYFCREKMEKIEYRRQLAEKLKLKSSALQVKIHRLKNVLRQCLEKCLQENSL